MKPKLVMIGSCPRCGKEYQRKLPVDAAACMCQNPDAILVPLYPTLIMPARVYAKFSAIAELTDVSVEKLVNALLTEGTHQTLEKLKSVPQIAVTMKKAI